VLDDDEVALHRHVVDAPLPPGERAAELPGQVLVPLAAGAVAVRKARVVGHVLSDDLVQGGDVVRVDRVEPPARNALELGLVGRLRAGSRPGSRGGVAVPLGRAALDADRAVHRPVLDDLAVPDPHAVLDPQLGLLHLRVPAPRVPDQLPQARRRRTPAGVLDDDEVALHRHVVDAPLPPGKRAAELPGQVLVPLAAVAVAMRKARMIDHILGDDLVQDADVVCVDRVEPAARDALELGLVHHGARPGHMSRPHFGRRGSWIIGFGSTRRLLHGC
jgi:hypothetical protein